MNMPEEITGLRRSAVFEVHNGPHSAESHLDMFGTAWPGYLSAIEKLEGWASKNICEAWVAQHSDDVAETDTDDPTYTYFSRRAVGRVLFSVLITDGGMNL